MGKNILRFTAILIPLLLFILLPWLISFAKPEWRDSSFPTIWACVTFGIMAASVVGFLIYGGVTNMDLTKTKLFLWVFGK